LENAALIDGCGIFSAFVRIILPNSKSSMLVGIILSMVWQWNNYFEPSIYIQKTDLFGNLPMQLENIAKNVGSTFAGDVNAGVTMAATFFTVLPIIIVFFLLQGRFMKGIERVGLAN
jgi:multiple sugar transport system permease protein